MTDDRLKTPIEEKIIRMYNVGELPINTIFNLLKPGVPLDFVKKTVNKYCQIRPKGMYWGKAR